MLGGETCIDKCERILLVYYTLVHCERVNFKVTDISFMTVYPAKGGGLILARVTTILPRCWEQYILCPFGMHQHTAVRLRRVEAVKLAQAGLGLLSGHSCEEVEGEA